MNYSHYTFVLTLKLQPQEHIDSWSDSFEWLLLLGFPTCWKIQRHIVVLRWSNRGRSWSEVIPLPVYISVLHIRAYRLYTQLCLGCKIQHILKLKLLSSIEEGSLVSSELARIYDIPRLLYLSKIDWAYFSSIACDWGNAHEKQNELQTQVVHAFFPNPWGFPTWFGEWCPKVWSIWNASWAINGNGLSEVFQLVQQALSYTGFFGVGG